MIWSLVGVLLGSLPGFHPNLLISLGFRRQELFQIVLGSLFSSIIPSTLFVPSADMSALLLPGQEAVKKGQLQRAVEEFAGGALMGGALYLILAPIYPFVPKSFLKAATLPFLVLTVAIMILRSRNRLAALAFFFVSGMYGFFVLSQGNANSALGVHFSSMFGLAGLYMSSKAPPQKMDRPRIRLKFPESFAGTMGGLLISLFPAITPAQAYTVLVVLFGTSAKGLAAAGAMSTSAFLFSFESYWRFGKGRMATVEGIKWFDFEWLIAGMAVGYFATIVFGKYVVRAINKLRHIRELAIAAVVSVMVVAYTDSMWFAIPSFLLGISPYYLGFERVHLMGSLLLPTIMWYLSNG